MCSVEKAELLRMKLNESRRVTMKPYSVEVTHQLFESHEWTTGYTRAAVGCLVERLLVHVTLDRSRLQNLYRSFLFCSLRKNNSRNTMQM